jgi:ABC-type glycerol-3-phosphate transport system substrate-binding protein
MKVAAVLCSFGLLFVIASKSPAQTNWKGDWEKLVKAAREEGRLTVYGTTVFEDVFKFFQKAYPEIKLSFVVGRGAEIAPRLMQERRAGKYLADIYTGGMHSPYELFYRSKALNPIPPALILPEVLDESKWWGGKHHYVDQDNQYIFLFEGSVQGGGISYNKNLVDPKERSLFGICCSRSGRARPCGPPRMPGMISQNLTFIYHNPKLGPNTLESSSARWT